MEESKGEGRGNSQEAIAISLERNDDNLDKCSSTGWDDKVVYLHGIGDSIYNQIQDIKENSF